MTASEGGWPVLYDSQASTTGTGPVYQPGTVFVERSGAGRAQWAMVKYVKLDNNGCSQGEVLVMDDGQTSEYGVKKAATTDGDAPHFRGLARATIASNAYGFMVFAGYCEKADTSHTVASGELLCVSGSTAGKVTPNKCSSFWGATLGLSSTVGTAPFAFAVARGAFATGVGSVTILGHWG